MKVQRFVWSAVLSVVVLCGWADRGRAADDDPAELADRIMKHPAGSGALFDRFLGVTVSNESARAELAERITKQIEAGDDVHDFLDDVPLLGRLGAGPQLIRLLCRDTDLACCFYQSVIEELEKSVKESDVPTLRELEESEDSELAGLAGQLIERARGGKE